MYICREYYKYETMYTEITKIIECGLSKDSARVAMYAKLLAEKYEADGEKKMSAKIRSLLDSNIKKNSLITEQFLNLPVDNETRLSIADILSPEINTTELILSNSVQEAVKEFVEVIEHKEKFMALGIEIHNSLLLYGPPGCGKTSLAKYIAKSIQLPIIIARLDSMISSLLGNTSKNIRKLFEFADNKPCILFLDEFDAIAKNRKDQNEQGELKRVINSLLQNIDDFLANGNILIAATNHQELLDDAIWRRFEKVIFIDRPGLAEKKGLINSLISKFANSLTKSDVEKMALMLDNLSYSEIKKVINGSITKSVINNRNEFNLVDVVYGYFQYQHSNEYTEEELVRFLSENNISQKEIAKFIGTSIRQIRNSLNLK
ncbi:hypothetical protein HMPREF1214_01720 [Bacteroides sp. HPS0048]|uniref:ATPase n=2 Tax=Bacteroides TaxID=816 RepID=A0A401LPV7_9BACE|nr:hypothetical protein HMPREF1214_01720 [Bacteroides sp. HPS0048]GCB33586.1 ATPase [Bacteroides faecalis]